MHNYTKYFKETKGFDRLITKLYQKYQSLSKFTGTIKINNLTKEETITLSRFFGTTYQEGTNITISIKKFIAIMESSKYEDFDIATLVSEYLNINLTTNKETKIKKEEEQNSYYNTIIGTTNSNGSNWLKHVITNKTNPYKLLQQRYHQNKKTLEKDLINVINLINNLPNEKTLLQIYASTYTKDPHYLDLDNIQSILFFYAL